MVEVEKTAKELMAASCADKTVTSEQMEMLRYVVDSQHIIISKPQI